MIAVGLHASMTAKGQALANAGGRVLVLLRGSSSCSTTCADAP
jgi:hypothetical protein